MPPLRTAPDAVARWLAVVAAVAFLAVLAWLLPAPGYRPSRLALFVLLAGFAVVGAVGAVARRPRPTAVGAAGLFALGFWQAVLSVFVLPVVVLLLVAAFFTRSRRRDETAP